MKKAPEAFRTIGEVADLLATPAHVLRFWESRFYQIKPVKRAGGRRYYRPDDVALIAGIRHLLQDKGMTIRGVQKVLQEEGVRHVAGLAPPISADPESSQADAARAGAAFDAAQDVSARQTGPDEPDKVTAFPVPPRREAPSPAAAPIPPPPFTGAESRAALDGVRGVPEDKQTPAFRHPATQHSPVAGVAADDKPASAAPPADRAELRDIDRAEADQTPAEPMPLERPAQVLRRMPRGSLGPRAEQLAILVGRIDRLLDRMSEASGAGRW